MLPGKKRKIAIAIGSLVGASAIIAGVTIPIILKNKNDDETKIDLSDFKKLETKFDKIEKQLSIKQTNDFNLSTSSGQKIIKDHIFSLISFTKKEKASIFLITKKGIITSKNRLEVVFQIKIDDQKKEYQFQVKHFSSNDEIKLYGLKQKINRYDLEEVIVIDQTKTFNQNLIKQTIIDEINKVNTKKLTTIEKNALSFNDKNISLSEAEEKNVVVLTTFGKEIAAYTFIISLQKPTDESNFLKLKNKFDSINLEQTISQTFDLDLSVSYNQELVKNFLFSLKNFSKKEKASISIITSTGNINKTTFTNVDVKIAIGSKKENAKTYTFKLKTSSDVNNANWINLINKFNNVDTSQEITLPILQIIDLANENARKILLNKIINYVNSLNSNNLLNQLEKNALSIETKLGVLSHNKITNVIVKMTLGNKNKDYNFKILKLKNQDEVNFNLLKNKFDKFKKQNDQTPILWKKEVDNNNYLYRQKFYDVLFQSIDEQNPNNPLQIDEKNAIKINFFSRGDDESNLIFAFSSIKKFNVKISFGELKKSYRLKITRKPFTKPIDQKGFDDFHAKLKKANLDNGKTEARKNPIEIENDFDLSNDSNHDYIHSQIINIINKKNPGNELTRKERLSIINTFELRDEKINPLYFYNFVFQISYNSFYLNGLNKIDFAFKVKNKNQLSFDNLKNKFDKATNKEIILKNEPKDLLLSNLKIKAAIINKINAFNANNSIENEEEQYIIVKDDSSSRINYRDWTNVIVEIKIDSIKREYIFKIKREKHDNDFKKQFDDLNEKMIKIWVKSNQKETINIYKNIDNGFSPSDYEGDITIESSRFNNRIYDAIDDLLKNLKINGLSSDEKKAIKIIYDEKIHEDLTSIFIFHKDYAKEINWKRYMRIIINYSQYYNSFDLDVIWKK